MPSKYEMVLSNTYDVWFAPWAEKSKTTGLGATPAEAFKIGTGVELLDRAATWPSHHQAQHRHIIRSGSRAMS